MKLKEKAKRYLAVGGGTVACIALIAAISLQFKKEPAGEGSAAESSRQETEIFVDPSGATESRGEETPEVEPEAGKEAMAESKTAETEGTGIVIQPNTSTENTGQAVDARPAQTDQTEQSIQPEPTKPETPDEETLKDPAVKPDGTKVEGEPEAVEHDAVERPAETESTAGTPQAGDTSGNQIYVPGFGWVENHGGGGSGTVAEDMYENGNKIGIMD